MSDSNRHPEPIRQVEFPSQGTRCHGWWLPSASATPDSGALVVMAHGLGGTVEGGLMPYAMALQQADHSVLAFDYRHFGRSAGEPRQLLGIRRQQQDYLAAIDHARSLEPLRPLVLWGTSFSSAHVLQLAARRRDIAAVIAMNPMLDGQASSLVKLKDEGIGTFLRMTGAGLADLIRGSLGRSPHYIPLAGESGTLAALTAPDALEGIQRFAGDDFDNRIAPRALLALGLYRPVKVAHRLSCPLLLQLCLRDSVTPIAPGYRLADSLKDRVTLKTYDTGHFAIYEAPWQPRLAEDQANFLARLCQGPSQRFG
ncbi:lysophospholipase [Halomonas sp. DP5Y7-2]|uniref:alpha/beta hydrolase n=1 Tax=Halomonas sp. DP5Y7-2 TaxID=2859076 RepID=UPI001C99ABA6|nr:alpha/beta fold hydrolase [Halomonas sp. DP5Y7-2]MBY5985690.1 lysophospholipase [Halomonas sp. DP5Y7-2]